jgi:2-C-methyl-D-erythritol 4-phosphate cytidylyltransferase
MCAVFCGSENLATPQYGDNQEGKTAVTATPRRIAIVPAAGVGSRMACDVPKQYLPLLGKPLLFHTLQTLVDEQRIHHIWVVLSVGDLIWNTLDWTPFRGRVTPLFCGGATRADTVLSALRVIGEDLSQDDWVLVHDAARPCLASWHLDRLLDHIGHHEVGGLLAVPVADTLKRGDFAGHVLETIPREGLWQAQTPQMFRYIVLRRCLEAVGHTVTDEASAIERAGLAPLLVPSDSTNLKVTFPLERQLAEWILTHRTGPKPHESF